MVRDQPFLGGLSHDTNQSQMGIYLFIPRNQSVVHRHAGLLAASASSGLLLVDHHADRDLGGQDLDRLISLGATLYHRMAFPAIIKPGYWQLKVLLRWFAEKTMKALPAPDNKVLYLIADGSKKDKRGQKNPAAQKGRLSEHQAWFFGIKFVVLMVAWEGYRLPVDFEIVRPKGHPDYHKENELFRLMLSHFQPPAWAKVVIVLADAAFAAKENVQMIQARDKADPHRRWSFIFAIARTWNMENGKSLKNLVKHTPPTPVIAAPGLSGYLATVAARPSGYLRNAPV